jgi:hypothetical protein
MIELISMSNWLYLKSQLYQKWTQYLTEWYDCGGGPQFREFVEQAFKGVLKWNQYCAGDMTLDIIGNDDELALDMLDAISTLDIEQLRDDDYWFDFIYVDSLGAAIVEWHVKGSSENDVTDEEYSRRVQNIRNHKLTILARLLDVVRQSKSGE